MNTQKKQAHFNNITSNIFNKLSLEILLEMSLKLTVDTGDEADLIFARVLSEIESRITKNELTESQYIKHLDKLDNALEMSK